MVYVLMALFAAVAVVLDQLSKVWVVENIALFEKVPVLDGLFHLTYVQNTGAAFSSFQGMRWLFLGIFVILTVLLFLEYFKKRLPFTTLERWCIAAIYGGGLGNMIDRVVLGYVEDMIQTQFMNFPVFNVADCFITCGCILLMVHLVFFNKKFWKDGKK